MPCIVFSLACSLRASAILGINYIYIYIYIFCVGGLLIKWIYTCSPVQYACVLIHGVLHMASEDWWIISWTYGLQVKNHSSWSLLKYNCVTTEWGLSWSTTNQTCTVENAIGIVCSTLVPGCNLCTKYLCKMAIWAKESHEMGILSVWYKQARGVSWPD